MYFTDEFKNPLGLFNYAVSSIPKDSTNYAIITEQKGDPFSNNEDMRYPIMMIIDANSFVEDLNNHNYTFNDQKFALCNHYI